MVLSVWSYFTVYMVKFKYLLAQEYLSFSQLKTMLLWGAGVLVAKNFTELT